ncbi:MAG: Flp pilus assembly complex ATPase component TadA [Elusimicrobia bacterium]|nr:Flp pilus assembly complex ATPase component TadA [Elusimicrobiota bacterium]MDE2236277.1 Flp pilus assembly complex ATPase component TadA [Elusimicrobiota bacterium]MDE2426555.1 Flp pilus assembly complex ATPase component TadA [Elusimicrobiota bacterium]
MSARLGDLLVSEGMLTYVQMNECLEEHKKTGAMLSAVIVRKGYLTEGKLVEFICAQCGFKFLRLDDRGPVKPDVLRLVPEKIIRQKLLLPIAFAEEQLTVAMSDPFNIMAVDEIKIMTGLKVNVVIAPEGELREAIDRAFGTGESAKKAAEDLQRQGGEVGVIEEAKRAADAEGDEGGVSISKEDEGGVIQIVNLLLGRAIKAGASDIHIEPYQKLLRVRYRMDGVLHDQASPPKKFLNAIVSRLKIMADLDISERRRPQDGRIKVRVDGKEVDLRISVCPCAPGEKVVMRIMDSAAMQLDVGRLGMDPENSSIYSKHIQDPYGIVLVTGPTGSGKSTTLYSTLHTLNTPDVNIMTAEDPVEFQLQGINQVQCNPDIGLTFAASLRSFLRQDPDIIMVGEIRDQETITIAINAALTGHLVFSTLHTNDAPGAITRILMMGIEPVLICSALTMVVAQRLVRTICRDCREAYEVDREWLATFGVPQRKLPEARKVTLYRGKGCPSCSGTGYRGRKGVHEVLEINDELRELIGQRATALKIKETAMRNGMITLQESAIRKLLSGDTTAEEVLRVTGAHS